MLERYALDVAMAALVSVGAVGILLLIDPTLVNFVAKPTTETEADRAAYVGRVVGIGMVVLSAFMFCMKLSQAIFSK